MKLKWSRSPFETRAIGHICRNFQGPGFLLVGDAACFIDPILSSGVHLAMDGAGKAALAINTFLGQPEFADQAMQWYEEEYQDNASNFLQMAEHSYVGHQSQRAWFSTAKKRINPNRNLSIRQAFIYLSGGHVTEAPHQQHPSMQALGGWSSVELATMYDHFAEVSPRGNGRRSGQRARPRSAPESSDRTAIKNVDATVPSFEPGVRYGPYMLEQGNALTPVFQIVGESDGPDRQRRSRDYSHSRRRGDDRHTTQWLLRYLGSLAGYKSHESDPSVLSVSEGKFRDISRRSPMGPRDWDGGESVPERLAESLLEPFSGGPDDPVGVGRVARHGGG